MSGSAAGREPSFSSRAKNSSKLRGPDGRSALFEAKDTDLNVADG